MTAFYDQIRRGGIALPHLKTLELVLRAFSAEELAGFTAAEDWLSLSRNRNLPFSAELIERFSDRWNWEELSLNRGIPWSEDLVERFKDRWFFKSLGINHSFCRRRDLVDRYLSYLDLSFSVNWGMFDDWCAETMASHLSPRNYFLLSYLSYDKLKRIRDEKLVDDPSLKIKIVEGYTKIDLRVSYNRPDGSNNSYRVDMIWKPLGSIDEAMALREEERKAKKYPWWNGVDLCWRSDAPWTLELLRKYENQLKFGSEEGSGLSDNKGLFWTEEIVREYRERLNWEKLSRNPSLPWSQEFLEEYGGRLDWNILLSMLCDREMGPENSRYEVLYGLICDAVNAPGFSTLMQESSDDKAVWQWAESISRDEVSAAYRKRVRQWKRRPFLNRMEEAASSRPGESGEILARFIRSCMTREILLVFRACYGPSRLSFSLFCAFLSQLFLNGEEEFYSHLKKASFRSLVFHLPVRPENLFRPLAAAQPDPWQGALEREFREAVENEALNVDNFKAAHPLLWVCFPKKEFTPPVWDVTPGVGLGPFVLGRPRSEIVGEWGEPDSIDRSGWEHYFHDHLQLIYEDEALKQIVVDRFGGWSCLAHGDRVNQIHHFRVRAYGRFPFEENPRLFDKHFVHELEMQGSVDIDRSWEYKYPQYVTDSGLVVTLFDRDYLSVKWPVTQIDIV